MEYASVGGDGCLEIVVCPADLILRTWAMHVLGEYYIWCCSRNCDGVICRGYMRMQGGNCVAVVSYQIPFGVVLCFRAEQWLQLGFRVSTSVSQGYMQAITKHWKESPKFDLMHGHYRSCSCTISVHLEEIKSYHKSS